MSMIRKEDFDRRIQKATPIQAVDVAILEAGHVYENSETTGGRKWAFSQYRKGYEIGLELVPNRAPGVDRATYANVVKETIQRIGLRHSPERMKGMVVLALMRLDGEDGKTYMVESATAVRAGMDFSQGRREIVSVDQFLSIGEGLLDAGSYLARILGLCAMTGRRTVEIACTARFEKTGPDEVCFSGQAKTRGRNPIGPYRIPTLVPADRVLECLGTIRADKPDLVENPEIFHSRCAKDLHVRARVFSEVFNVGNAKPKDLRPAYAEIAWLLFDERRTGKQLYFSRILGHSSDDIATASSYDDFIIADPNY